MRILIIGAGAVGGFYGTKLALAGEDVTFLTRGATFEALKKHDLVVKSFRGDFHARVHVVDSLEGYAPPDLLVLAVKSYDTDQIIGQIRPVVGDGTLLLSFQNGVENEIKLATAFGREKVLGCVCYIGAEVVEPGVIHHSARGTVAIGEMTESGYPPQAGGRGNARSTRSAEGGMAPQTNRLDQIVETFRKARIEVHASGDIRRDLWIKLCWNTAFNQVCTVARATVGVVLESEAMHRLLRATMREVFAVAARHGVELSESIIDQHLTLSSEELRSVKPSMLQDFERGRRLEHETFSGFIVREGEKFGLPVPINTTLYEFLNFLDQISARELNL
ncbi:MAG TPA: 2-dehydropantoate 2-reductase [bacterium]|nr:2-dehydropantoate 2-reductase [bacterium]